MPQLLDDYRTPTLDALLMGLQDENVPYELRIGEPDGGAAGLSTSEYAGRLSSLAPLLNKFADLRRGRHVPGRVIGSRSSVDGGLRIYPLLAEADYYRHVAAQASSRLFSLGLTKLRNLPIYAHYAAGELTVPLTNRASLDVDAQGAMSMSGEFVRLTRLFRGGRGSAQLPARFVVSTRIEVRLAARLWASITVGGQMEAEAFRVAYQRNPPKRLDQMVHSQASRFNRIAFEKALLATKCDAMFTAEDSLARQGVPIISRTHAIVSGSDDRATTRAIEKTLAGFNARPLDSRNRYDLLPQRFTTDVGVVRWIKREDYFGVRGVPIEGVSGQMAMVASAWDAADDLHNLGGDFWRESSFGFLVDAAVGLEGPRGLGRNSIGGAPYEFHQLD